MKKLKVALLAGGNSSEREISLQSAAMVAGAFDTDRYDVYTIDVFGREWTHTGPDGKKRLLDRNDFSLAADGEEIVLDYAFIMIHGTPGEDGMIQAYLDMMGIPYSSSGFSSTVVTFDKILCKRTVASIPGLRLAKEVLIKKGSCIDPERLVAEVGLPMFIKPNASGSSYGVTKVKRAEDIPAALEAAFAESVFVLAEQFVGGREFGCGVIITKEKEYVFPVTEIISRNEFFDLQAKYTPGFSDEVTPAEIPDELAGKLQKLAREAYKACDCRGVARIDFIADDSGDVYFIEVNSVPGMSPGSIVPKQIVAAGMTMTEAIDIIIADTLCSR